MADDAVIKLAALKFERVGLPPVGRSRMIERRKMITGRVWCIFTARVFENLAKQGLAYLQLPAGD